MLINLRNAMMAGKQLPYDAEVEYIGNRGSTSYNYIKTGIFATNATKVSTTSKGSEWVFGSRKSAGNSALGVFKGASATTYAYGSDSVPVSGNITTAVNTIEISESGAYLDGNLVASFTSGQTFSSSPYEIYIFNINNGGNVGNNLSGEIYSCKIWQNSVLVRDYIPVRKGTVGYLYDRVSGKLFGNAGTGDFVLGPDVVPVEYIESHGTEYIDTRFVPTSLTRFDVDMQFTSMPTTYWGCGIYAMSPVRRFNLGASTTKFNLSYGDNNDISASVDTARHSYSLDAANLRWAFDSLNGSYAATVSSAFPDALFLFARNNGRGGAENKLSGRIFSCNIWEDGDPVRTFSPVRVGTGSTWEGAMMDVLTRRIYRNAGTGAFAYGNDLKYPIPAE